MKKEARSTLLSGLLGLALFLALCLVTMCALLGASERFAYLAF